MYVYKLLVEYMTVHMWYDGFTSDNKLLIHFR